MSSVEIIKKIAESEAKKRYILELGLVTSVFPHSGQGDKDNYECNVKLKNGDLELRKVPIATHHIGFTYAPNVGDLVLLAFVNGSINLPVVIGRLYNDEQRPPENKPGETIYVSPDPKKAGIRRLYMKLPNGITLTITDDLLKAEVGKSIVTVKTDGDITVESNARVHIRSKGDMKLESDGDMTFKARSLVVDSMQSINIESGTDINARSKGNTNISAAAAASLKAGAKLDLKGTMININ